MPASKNYLRPQQVERLKDEKVRIEKQLANPNAEVTDRSLAHRRVQSIEKHIATEAPPETTGEQRDVLAKQEKELREAMLVGMPSQEEMRRGPDGATDKHIAWEKRNKRRLQLWKNIQLMLNRGSDERDVANFEKFRPRTSTLGMHSAVLGRSPSEFSFPSQAFMEGYDNIDWGKKERLGAVGDLVDEPQAVPDRADELVKQALKADTLKDLRRQMAKEAKEMEEAASSLPSALGLK